MKYCVQLCSNIIWAYGTWPYTALVPKTSKRVKRVECTILMDGPISIIQRVPTAGLKDDNGKPVKQLSSHQDVDIYDDIYKTYIATCNLLDRCTTF